jgi:hypothetical protein
VPAIRSRPRSRASAMGRCYTSESQSGPRDPVRAPSKPLSDASRCGRRTRRGDRA